MFYIFVIFVTIINFTHGILPPSRKALPGEANFMIRITDGKKFCGGTLIRDNIVLTAGHCSDFPIPGNVIARAGTNFAFENDKGQRRNAEQLLPHENFKVGKNYVQAYNDIGLIKLSEPFDLDMNVQTIDWAPVNWTEPAFMFGFGYEDDEIALPSDYLRTRNVTFIPDGKCEEMLAETLTKSVKESYELCAEKCACNGDSGSPLLQMVNGVPKIVGITSWLADDLFGCNTPPAVFLKVSEFNSWLTEKLKDLEMDNTIISRSKEDAQSFSHRFDGNTGKNTTVRVNHRNHRQHELIFL